MKLLTKNFKGKWIYPILTSLFILIVVLWIRYAYEANQKLLGIISGLITGFIVLVFQVLLSWVELRKMEKFDALHIKDILPRKDEREFYAKFISTAEKKLWMLAVTANRFLEDFADDKSTWEGAKALLDLLNKGVEVRFLVADLEQLVNDTRHIDKARSVEPRLIELSKQFTNFKYAYYKHLPMHSVLTIDDTSIVGPIFPDVASKNTPAIHLENDSAFVKHYLKYFRDEWEKWSKDKEVLQD